MKETIARYQKHLLKVAREAGYSSEEIAFCLEYANRLHSQGLPILFHPKQFSEVVGYSEQYLYGVANSPSSYYRRFYIPKKNGGTRKISEPLPSLKIIQRWLLDNILNKVAISKFAKGYRKGVSIKHNAKYHKKQQRVLRVDLENFFGTIGLEWVISVFRELGYSKSLSILMARLCCLNNVLPQGAPTSPCLSNIAMRRVDKRLAGFALSMGYRYTRYADDISMSGNLAEDKTIGFIIKAVTECGFVVNADKTRCMRPNQRQLVTGIVVNEKLNIPRKSRRDLRQAGYYISKYGIESHLEEIEEQRGNYIRHLLGRSQHALSINPKDRDAKKCKDILLSVLKVTLYED